MIEHGRLVVEDGPAGCPAAGEDLRALVHRVADLAGDPVAQVGAASGPIVNSRLGKVQFRPSLIACPSVQSRPPYDSGESERPAWQLSAGLAGSWSEPG